MSGEATGADWQPLLITVAPNGAYKTHANHPQLPVTAAQIAETAEASLQAGAAMIHLHVRDRQGHHSLEPALYAEAILAIRERLGDTLLIQATSEAAGRYDPGEQMRLMRRVRGADSMSLAIRELAADGAAEPAARDFFGEIAAAGILPQYIVYSAEDLARYQDLCRRAVIPDCPHLLLWVLGRYSTGQRSAPADLLPFLRQHDGRAPWAVCAFGPLEHASTLAAATFGGHIRVGFENNLHLKDGSLAEDNAALVQQCADAVAALGRPLADAAWLRGHFRLPVPG